MTKYNCLISIIEKCIVKINNTFNINIYYIFNKR